MLNPTSLEMMMDDIQAERQKAAEKARLARACRSSDPNRRGRVGNLISFIGLKVKEQLQAKPDVQPANIEIQAYPETK
jgi:hypothetical protein